MSNSNVTNYEEKRVVDIHSLLWVEMVSGREHPLTQRQLKCFTLYVEIEVCMVFRYDAITSAVHVEPWHLILLYKRYNKYYSGC